jgi:hypothetical protein
LAVYFKRRNKLNDSNKQQLEIMNSEKPYKLWMGGRNTICPKLLNEFAKTGIVKPIEANESQRKPKG